MDEKRVTLCLYHYPCADGFFAALAYANTHVDVVCIPHKTFEAIDLSTLPLSNHICLIDYCGPRGFLDACLRKYESVTLLDHHETAYKELESSTLKELHGKFTLHMDQKRSACIIASDSFRPHLTEERRRLYEYVQDNDLFLHRLPGSKEFTAALRARSIPWLFTPETMQQVYALSVDQLIQEGDVILARETEAVAQALTRAYWVRMGKEMYHAVDLEERDDCPISELGHQLAKATGYGVVCFPTSDGQWKLSLRSIGANNDTTITAAMYGGGGHKNASGCVFPGGRVAWTKYVQGK
jgi:oligoribonuclease NrnB/cAMP/cGMP phosphodiesterase (DHH superfamily)